MGIEIELAVMKEGEEVNKHLLCGICFMILEEPIQCVREDATDMSREVAKDAFAKNALRYGECGNTSVQTGVRDS